MCEVNGRVSDILGLSNKFYFDLFHNWVSLENFLEMEPFNRVTSLEGLSTEFANRGDAFQIFTMIGCELDDFNLKFIDYRAKHFGEIFMPANSEGSSLVGRIYQMDPPRVERRILVNYNVHLGRITFNLEEMPTTQLIKVEEEVKRYSKIVKSRIIKSLD